MGRYTTALLVLAMACTVSGPLGQCTVQGCWGCCAGGDSPPPARPHRHIARLASPHTPLPPPLPPRRPKPRSSWARRPPPAPCSRTTRSRAAQRPRRPPPRPSSRPASPPPRQRRA
ncbi:MAG: hypothetical protein J3K34DRAFT_438285 [Monoraphidium minutum]|nr:MAG: hypothetical protein J3K34DRAFT_438285 [Monoraphidium minutum]